MPTPKKGESESDFVARCVPIVMGEGKTQQQALGQCYGMFRSAKKSESIDAMLNKVQKELHEIKNQKLIAKYQDEINEVMKARSVGGFESPEPGGIPEKGKSLLAKVYARCRADGGDKEKCSKVAWAAVNRAGLHKSEMPILKNLQDILVKIKQELSDGENTPR